MTRRIQSFLQSQGHRRIVRGAMLVFVFAFLVGNRPDCDRRIFAAPREFGEGGISISTASNTLVVTVSASAARVAPGDPVDLSSSVSGGDSPFIYSWTSNPVGQINPSDVGQANPTVNPTISVTYILVVLDDAGATAFDSVSVSVGLGLGLVVSPDVTIPVGGSTQLEATPSGGDGDFSYSWSPASGLATRPSPTRWPVRPPPRPTK